MLSEAKMLLVQRQLQSILTSKSCILGLSFPAAKLEALGDFVQISRQLRKHFASNEVIMPDRVYAFTCQNRPGILIATNRRIISVAASGAETLINIPYASINSVAFTGMRPRWFQTQKTRRMARYSGKITINMRFEIPGLDFRLGSDLASFLLAAGKAEKVIKHVASESQRQKVANIGSRFVAKYVGILCSVFGHSWEGQECDRCGKHLCAIAGHSWGGCKCERCGECREDEVLMGDRGRVIDGSHHTWDGCVCVKCGKARTVRGSDNWDGKHVWSRTNCDICKRCGTSFSELHPEHFTSPTYLTTRQGYPTRHQWSEWSWGNRHLVKERRCWKCGKIDEQAFAFPGG